MKDILGLKYPVIGLSPMDGITDQAYRYITKKYGNPDLIITEFTNVMGLCIAGDKLLHHFEYDESQRPIIGQIYGKEPEYFYHAAKVVCELGFDGVDINMGCPAKTVAQSGSGAALIKTPDLAREIIASVKKGVQDWVENGELTGLSNRTHEAVIEMRDRILKTKRERKLIPVSVKTRIGYDVPVTEDWIANLVKEEPAWITVHGRTLKQLYTGEANWDEIKKAVEITDIPILANGDVKEFADIQRILDYTGAYGVLVGRGTYGNPWFFQTSAISRQPSVKQKISVMIEHTKKFLETNPDPKAFFQMRKNFGWYMSGFDNAKEIRMKLMTANSLRDVEQVISELSNLQSV